MKRTNFAIMDFYKSISDHYDNIFPFKPIQQSFVNSLNIDPKNSSVLDVGCGTGSLCIELVKDFKMVTGIDPDEKMLEIAKEKAGQSLSNLHFYPYGMQDLEGNFEAALFDVILCLGNTLVHLKDESEITDFLQDSYKLLPEGGKMLIQIINYDRIIDQNVRALPTIENEHIRFVRNYDYNPQNNQLAFETILHIKADGDNIRNIIQLYPIRKASLEDLLIKAGFQMIRFYGDFKKSPLIDQSVPLIVEAQK